MTTFPALGRAVIGSEDQNFCKHHGFGLEVRIDKASRRTARTSAARREHHQSTGRRARYFCCRCAAGSARAPRLILPYSSKRFGRRKRILHGPISNLVDWVTAISARRRHRRPIFQQIRFAIDARRRRAARGRPARSGEMARPTGRGPMSPDGPAPSFRGRPSHPRRSRRLPALAARLKNQR